MAQAIFRADGNQIPHSPVSAVAAGDVVLVGTIPHIASIIIAAGDTGTLQIKGIYECVKDSSVFSAGDAVYWNPTGNPVGGTAGTGAMTSTASGAHLAGYAVAAQLTGDATVRVNFTAAKRTTTIGGAVTASDITAEDSTLTITGLAGSAGSAGGTVTSIGGAGDTNGAGGAVGSTGGAGAGSGAGGANNQSGGTGGATGAGGAATFTGGPGGASSGTGGAATVAGGPGSAGNANGGDCNVRGGAKHGSGTDGVLNLGMTNTSQINMGKEPLRPTGTVAAAGSNQGDAAALALGFNLVTAADGTKGVLLPTAAAGKKVVVKNNANAVLKVWPASGDAINALSADAAMSIAAFTCPELTAYDATTWYTNPLLPS